MMMNDGPMNIRKLMDALLRLDVFTSIADPVGDDRIRPPIKNRIRIRIPKTFRIWIQPRSIVFSQYKRQSQKPC